MIKTLLSISILKRAQLMLIVLLRTLAAGIFLLAWSFFLLPLLLLCTLVPYKYRHNKLLYLILFISYRAVIYSLLLPVIIKGEKNLRKKPMIIVANHQSLIDTPLLGMVVGTDAHCWIALEYYANMPIIGRLIRKLFVAVDTSTASSSAKALVKLLRLAQNIKGHIIIFPEGGRFSDGQIHEFLPGFGLVAKKTGYPVVPVLMPNNYKVMPVGSICINYAPLEIIIGEPFHFEDYETEEKFVQRVQNWFVTENDKY